MNDSEYGFLFKPNGNEEQGPSNSGEEIFSDDTIAQALARELGQNSLDAIAKDDAWPVTMVFELHRMKVEDIPDVNNLRRHLRAALGRYPDSPRLQEAVKTLDGECIDVLRVGDYGTKGLSGSESIADSGSVLTALTRGSGVSVGKTDAGGSFGIGKSVGILSSLVRTEFWTTRTPDSDETVFAGCTQLTTHQVPGSDDPRQLLGPMGTYTLLSDMQDYRYLRDPAPLGPFSQRTEPGTDVYIIGYSAAGDDPRLEQIRDAMIDNFMAAIMRGHLVVDGVTDKGRGWHLDSGSLKRVIDSIPDPERRTVMQAFHNALLQPPVVRNDSRLGEMKLYINIDDSLPRKLNTIVMRKPLMKVRAYTNTSITAKYAAVLECSSPQGNRILRGMEPVRHDDWQAARDKQNGKAVLRSIKKFILEELRKRVRRELGDEITIKGLNTLLPSELQIDGNPDRHGVRASNGPGSERESASLQGRETTPEPVANTGGKSVNITLTKPAVTDEDGSPASTGRQRGWTGQARQARRRHPGHGTVRRRGLRHRREQSVHALLVRREKRRLHPRAALEERRYGKGSAPAHGRARRHIRQLHAAHRDGGGHQRRDPTPARRQGRKHFHRESDKQTPHQAAGAYQGRHPSSTGGEVTWPRHHSQSLCSATDKERNATSPPSGASATSPSHPAPRMSPFIFESSMTTPI